MKIDPNPGQISVRTLGRVKLHLGLCPCTHQLKVREMSKNSLKSARTLPLLSSESEKWFYTRHWVFGGALKFSRAYLATNDIWERFKQRMVGIECPFCWIRGCIVLFIPAGNSGERKPILSICGAQQRHSLVHSVCVPGSCEPLGSEGPQTSSSTAGLWAGPVSVLRMIRRMQFHPSAHFGAGTFPSLCPPCHRARSQTVHSPSN